MNDQPTVSKSPTLEDSRAHRHTRLIYAFSTMAASKCLAAVTQFLALPLALAALGTDGYATFLTLVAFMSWVGLAALGLGPTLPRFISDSVTKGDMALQRDLVMSSLGFAMLVAVALAAGLLFLGNVVPLRTIISAAPLISSGELHMGYRAVVLLMCGQLVVSISAAIRSGFQELHWTASWAMAGNIAIIACLVMASKHHLTIWQMAVLLYGPMLAALWLDMATLFIQRPYLLTFRFRFSRFVRLIGIHSANTLVVQTSIFLLAYVPTIIVAHVAGARATASYGSIMQPLVVVLSGINLVIAPLVPAIANAQSLGDVLWTRHAYLRALGVVMGLATLVAVTLATAGPSIFRLWLHRDLGITHALCISFGLYFIVWVSSLFHFNVLAAMGKIGRTGRVYVLEALLALGLGWAFVFPFGETGMAAGLACGIGAMTGWYLPMRVWRSLNSKITSHPSNGSIT